MKNGLEAGLRVVALEDLADIPRGRLGTVLDIDEDGDARVLFDGEEEASLILAMDLECIVPGSSGPSPCRLRLTREGAKEVLEELSEAYADTGFREQLRKLARDMRWDGPRFRALLPQVALQVQQPVLCRWGFAPDPSGIVELEHALRDYADGDEELKHLSSDVTRRLFGDMYEIVFADVQCG